MPDPKQQQEQQASEQVFTALLAKLDALEKRQEQYHSELKRVSEFLEQLADLPTDLRSQVDKAIKVAGDITEVVTTSQEIEREKKATAKRRAEIREATKGFTASLRKELGMSP
jgi:predicted  nucleic acid-binding Zn-ribbon protein